MFKFHFNRLANRRSGSFSRQGTHRPSTRCTPRVDGLEVRALLSTITVTNDGDSGNGSLRQALASAVAGETIKFARSAYGTITLTSGLLEVATRVTINGPGADNVTINGNNAFQDFQVDSGATATISGLTITGGVDSQSGAGGGGIVNNGTLTVANCTITDNSSNDAIGGGGIVNDGTLTVTNSLVTGNSAAAGSGGGINNNGTGTLTVTGSTITNNSAPTGDGGGFANGAGALIVRDSVVTNNTASEGGGISDNLGTLTVTRGTVSENTALAGGDGGGILAYEGTLTMTNSTIASNTSGDTTSEQSIGGGIFAYDSSVNISGSLFQDNAAAGDPEGALAVGGAIAMETDATSPTGSSLNIANSRFLGNTAAGFFAYGGAIHTDAFTTVNIAGTTFSANMSIGDGYAEGGAIDLNQPNQATISGTLFEGNGAVVPSTTSTLGSGAEGGALFVAAGPVTIDKSTFSDNQALGGPGGGLAYGGAIDYQGPSTFDLSNSVLTNNQAIGGSDGGWGFGGALSTSVGGTVTVAHTRFVGNQAVGGAASQAGNQGGEGWGEPFRTGLRHSH